jgi:hypothetical protein
MNFSGKWYSIHGFQGEVEIIPIPRLNTRNENLRDNALSGNAKATNISLTF